MQAVQERGCQKSGRPVAFNISFLNAFGLHSVYEHACNFFANHLDNKLMISVYHDLHVTQCKIACQALGIVEKYVTAPLWRLIVKKEGCV